MKRKVIMSGGNQGFVPIGSYTLHGVVMGFEHLWHTFDTSIWEGMYIQREEVFRNPAILDGVDLWLLATETSFPHDPAVLAAIDYAQARGTKVMAEPNGGHGNNLMGIKQSLVDFWKKFDAIEIGINDPEAVEAFETITGKPCLGQMPPYVEEYFDHMVRLADNFSDMTLPEDIGERFVVPHAFDLRSWVTAQVAMMFGIKLHVTVFDSQVPGWINALEEPTGNLIMLDPSIRNHAAWLHVLRRSAGIFFLTTQPSHGRSIPYATTVGVPSLCCRHGWQVELYPELVLPPEFNAGVDWKAKVRLAESLIPRGQEALRRYTPAYCQDRIETWFDAHGWFR